MKLGDKVWTTCQCYGVNYLLGTPYRGIITSIKPGKIVLSKHNGDMLVTTHEGVINKNLFDLLEQMESWKFTNPIDFTIPTEQTMQDIETTTIFSA